MNSGIGIIVNRSNLKSTGIIDQIRLVLEREGIPAEIRIARGGELKDILPSLITAGWDPIVAAGGDGTVSTVAEAVSKSDCRMGILPLGTLNHFARDAGIPLDPIEAL